MRLLGIALASFSSGAWTKSYDCSQTPTHVHRSRRADFPPALNHICTDFYCRALYRVCPSSFRGIEYCVPDPYFFSLSSQPSNSQQLLCFGDRRSRDRWCISLVGGPWIGGTRGGGGVLGVSISSCSEKPTHTFLFQLMPSIIPLTYHFLLPSPSSLLSFSLSHSTNTNTPSAYVPLATADDAEELNDEDNGEFGPQGAQEEQELMLDDSDGKIIPTTLKKASVTLSAYDKWRLVKPLLGRYMLPLCTFFDFWNFGFGFFPMFFFLSLFYKEPG